MSGVKIPVIPREVAEAIEYLRKNCVVSANDILTLAVNGNYSRSLCSERKRVGYFAALRGALTLSAALVNGHTIEKSAEELAEEAEKSVHDRIRTLFKEHGSFAQRWALAERSYYDYGKHSGYQQGMRDALRELGVKITEVNA